MNDEPRVEFKVPTDDGLEVIMMLDKKGMTYQGKFIEDAGEAHDLFIDTMQQLKHNTKVVDIVNVFIISFLAGFSLCYFGLVK